MIVDPDFCDHWKTRMLVGLLDNDEAAPVYVLRLWSHCQNRRKSTFDSLPAEALKALCRFPGHSNKLEASLAASGFVRREGKTLIVCGWEEYNASLLAAWSNGSRGGRPPKGQHDEPAAAPAEKPTGKPTGSRVDKSRREGIGEEGKQYARAGGEPAAAGSGGGNPTPPEDAETDEWRRPGWAHDEWARIVNVWNATERAVPWTPLTPPNGFSDLAASPGWVDSAMTAIGLLPACKRFTRPVPWTQFVRDMDRILAGEFRDPPEQRRELVASGGGAGGRPQKRGNMR